MGRKRTHHEAARTKIVSARLKQETYDLITEHAAKMGLTRAGYIEHLVENRPLRIVRPLTDDLPVTLLNELKRIGNNLNQIAHVRNAGGDADPRAFKTVVAEIIAVICSNEVLKKRYDAAHSQLAGALSPERPEQLPLRKETPPPVPSKPPEPSPLPPTPLPDGPLFPPQVLPEASDRHFDEQTRATAENYRRQFEWHSTLRDQAPPPKRAPAQTVTDDDPKTSSSWFKLPWSKRVHPPRR